MQGNSSQDKSREFQEKQIYIRQFQAFLIKALPGMAIQGNYKEGNSKEDNFMQLHAMQFQERVF